MNRKYGLISLIAGLVLVLGVGVVFVFSQGASEVKGNGDIEELSPQAMKKFMKEEGTGFIIYSLDKDNRDTYLYSVKKAMENNNVEGKELNSLHPSFDVSKNQMYYGLEQNADTLAVYKDGEMKNQIDFEEYESSELEAELDHFIQMSKETYFEN
ncbi:hypothetical protein ABD68_12830 [Bacillus endophyticus]|uniref:hypothetical protein n=1 Tax=Priestia endophytica TaxID=135735 RepID=UPI0018CE2230|nr:hypothetical protein [Priestia endophytica]MBG9812162.1 hypothetical protein [Priestia endophytica]MBG9812344.1 hypothetical protein [Priestia endophytica]MBG9812360.1 hypothetical protein [Priestia endophytica]MBG9812448.1 hypothetical protein [Priestia endophytica]